MMRRLMMMVSAALLVAAPAWASLAVLLATDDRVIAASDTRQWDTTCDCPHPDPATKIVVRPPFVVAVTHDPAPRSAAAHLPIVAGESAADFAQRILDAVPHGPVASESTIAVVRLGGDAVVRHVRFEPEGRLVVLREAAPTLPVALVLGWPFAPDAEMAALVQRLTAELRTHPGEARLLDMAETTLQMGAARSPKIGGPMHLAVLDADGVRTPTASGGPRRWNGTGFWLDATGTPTFRVGNPSGNRLRWDGTNLKIVSANLTVDENGIHIIPTDSNNFSTTTDYGYTVSNGSLGYGANDGSTNGRYLFASSNWSGSCSGQRCQSWTVLDARADTDGTTATRGVASLTLATVAASGADANLSVILPGGSTYGEFDLFAYLDVQPDGTTNAAAGANTLPANPCGFFIMGYQGASVRVPFYAPNGGSCPTVP